MSKRCECPQPEPVRVNDNMEECAKCGGWFAVRLTSLEDLELFRQRFMEQKQ